MINKGYFMSVYSILDCASFAALDGDERAVVCDLFDETYGKKGRLTLNNKELFKGRKLLPISFEFYSHQLDTVNPASFKFLDDLKIQILEQDLLYAFYILSAQYQLAAELNLDAAESRRQDRRTFGERIKQCADLIYQLREAKRQKTPELVHLQLAAHDSTQYLAYLGLTTIPSVIVEGADAISTGSPELVKEWAGEGISIQVKDRRRAINSPRLYWVWAGGWIQSWIGLLSDYYIHKQEAQQALSAIAPLTGFMSFALYLTNASVEILMVAKHTVGGPWFMSKAESELSLGERFIAHADLRKYSITNDFVWGLGNLACFCWLVGKGTLGYYGNVATAGLLLMDLVLSYFQYKEASIQHHADLERYQRHIRRLEEQIQVYPERKNEFTLQLETLKKARARCEFEWTYKSVGLIKDCSYALALVLAFVVMCSFLLPPGQVEAASALILSIGGTVLCFVASLINDAAQGLIEIKKSKGLVLRAKTALDATMEQFQLEGRPDLKKLLYLDIKQSEVNFTYQAHQAYFQKVGLLHEMFIKLLVPPLVVASFILLPLNLGVGALGAGFALAIASGRLYIGKPPQLAQLPKFDDEAYQAFAGGSTNAQNIFSS